MPGFFISYEGPEGVGKTTQLNRLGSTLKAAGHNVIETREPGGTPEAESLRSVLLDPDMTWSPLAEALLMNAARDSHMQGLILPALAKGNVVLCDRFALSTRAYQGGGGDVSYAVLDIIEQAVCPRMPDLTLVFDLPVAEGLRRANDRGRADRFESKSLEYHDAVAANFRQLAARFGHPIIDAAGTPDEVEARVFAAVRHRLPGLL